MKTFWHYNGEIVERAAPAYIADSLRASFAQCHENTKVLYIRDQGGFPQYAPIPINGFWEGRKP
jgi:hypothetical protein